MPQDLYPRFIHPVLAWLISCVVAGCIVAIPMAFDNTFNDPEAGNASRSELISVGLIFTLFTAPVIMVATALPALVFVRIARWVRLPRG